MATSKVAPPQHLDREQFRQHHGIGRSDLDDVMGAHARGQQRLVRVAHRRVGDEQAASAALHPLGDSSAGPASSSSCFRPGPASMPRTSGAFGVLRRVGLRRPFTSGLPLTMTSPMKVRQLRRPVAARLAARRVPAFHR